MPFGEQLDEGDAGAAYSRWSGALPGRLPGDEEWKIMLRKWLFAVSCVVSLSTWIASPGLAQTASERATMILSKLPPHGSAAYRTLRKQAGDEATVEILSMTKSEVWSVAPDRIDTLKATAARLNAVVTGLAADWNHLFRPMPPHRLLRAPRRPCSGSLDRPWQPWAWA